MEIGSGPGAGKVPPAPRGGRGADRPEGEGRSGQAPPPERDRLEASPEARSLGELVARSRDGEADRERSTAEIKARLLRGELDRPEIFEATARILLRAGSEGLRGPSGP